MAAYAAHLTRTASGAPGVFTLAAQDALADTVKPALRRLLEYASERKDERTTWAKWALNWYDELYLALDALLQYHYLQHYAASFAESFYGLWRVPVGTKASDFADGHRLPPHLERASLILLILVPYIRDRATYFVEHWRDQYIEGNLPKGISGRARLAAVHTHTALHTVYECAKLVQMCRYVCGVTGAHAPALAALGLRLTSAPSPVDDHSWRDLWRHITSGNFREAHVSAGMVFGIVLRTVELGAFLVQFLRWWEGRADAAPATLPVPPVPTPRPELKRAANVCPLCLRPWRTPTVLPVSGYVFCYGCIERHLREHSACPVTRLPARSATLVRLYINS
ncbi:Peroxisome assembly protein 12 [Eumeta japonica]|uniref:Peroxisome assembly protein 12 n=1 Tax=Eumeta variegata TaxID=151549 RepID=A0A4C1U3H8_EUMVA|nr:Peroxisome assembly protein 12 [Eumeta japonica]